MLNAIPNRSEAMKRITNTMIRILAISIEKPAIPLAPKMYATNAITRNNIPSSSRLTIFYNHIPEIEYISFQTNLAKKVLHDRSWNGALGNEFNGRRDTRRNNGSDKYLTSSSRPQMPNFGERQA
jgi:hypothetical protein